MTMNDERKARGGGPAPLGADDEAAGAAPFQTEDELRRQRREVADASTPASYTDLWRRSKGLILALVLVAVLVVIFLMTTIGGPPPE
ncbi:hypothetical protein [Inquilinus sp. CAU 1745]|uniref:hypothetical protein n=1 Tax=Inquilinus sp. CAU 1745 TaxID=3140369 RepID=UPI00325A4B3D